MELELIIQTVVMTFRDSSIFLNWSLFFNRFVILQAVPFTEIFVNLG